MVGETEKDIMRQVKEVIEDNLKTMFSMVKDKKKEITFSSEEFTIMEIGKKEC